MEALAANKSQQTNQVLTKKESEHMAQSEQQRQRKLAKKQSKSREKHKLIARTQQSLTSMAGKMQASSRGEIIYCGICGTITSSGLGQVLIARQGPMRQVGLAVFLIDSGCLGVKDVLAILDGPDRASKIIEQLENDRDLKPTTPGLARGLVESAVAYAQSLGFEPHADYRKAAMIWGEVEAESIEGHYTLGREGKPFYMNGPFEDQARQQHILRTLERTVGEGNFHFMLGQRPVPNGIPGYLGTDDDRVEDEDEEFDSQD